MRKLLGILVLFVGLNVIQQDAFAQRPMHEIHSMLMFNFIKYVEWPASTKQGDFVITIVGNEDVYQSISKFFANRPVKGQNVKIENVADVSAVGASHVVYLDSGKSGQFDDLQSKMSGKPTLVITDRNGLGKKGSCINFKEVGGKLKFEINQASLDTNSLKVSSQLASMGIVI